MSGNMRRIVVMPGTGIGPEVTAQAVRIAEWFATERGMSFDISQPPSGLEAWASADSAAALDDFEAAFAAAR